MSASRSTILLVEDDPEIRRLVGGMLEREGFAVLESGDATAMEAVLVRATPDLIVLDLMLPGEDGLSICRRLRAERAIPILMLTAKADEIDRVLGLEIGADDYLVKPFSPRELLARIRAILRRVQPAALSTAVNRRFTFAAFEIDLDARELRHGPVPVALTTTEFDLLSCFIQRPRRVLTRDQILDWIRGRTADPFDRTVDMAISRLRRKLDACDPGANLITTVRNGGYLFTVPVAQVR